MVSGGTRRHSRTNGRLICRRAPSRSSLRLDGAIAGVCRVDPATGLIDAPGVVPAYRADLSGYEALLRAALSFVDAPSAAVESWGEGPERLAVCERLGLTTAEYTPGWEFVLRGDPGGRPP